MKNAMLLFLGLATVTWTAQASDQGRQTFSCHGVYDNKGTKVELTLNGDNYSLKGTTTPGSGFNSTVDCRGTFTDSSRDKKYDLYSTENNTDCPVDYVKVMKDLESQGSGMLILARTSGGDEHDYSGYSYCYYHCVEK